MKKVKLTNKITLDKEIISKLNEDQLKELYGGGAHANNMSCITGSKSCPNCKEAEREDYN
ncbi:hypothetical protein TH53_09785 [Pedobacter lusitanus]|uniref:Uncharacterized protein n=1 Tax=Pedobacter lusitanus TaxID=1503925 RepID=A0A0D0F725_9SPHI|nr:class I lanthipeptide [Pedobacter lusitanus]KIO77388.1 hypothetical protein TH53_09785 [Pedobacter lusitanus]